MTWLSHAVSVHSLATGGNASASLGLRRDTRRSCLIRREGGWLPTLVAAVEFRAIDERAAVVALAWRVDERTARQPPTYSRPVGKAARLAGASTPVTYSRL